MEVGRLSFNEGVCKAVRPLKELDGILSIDIGAPSSPR